MAPCGGVGEEVGEEWRIMEPYICIRSNVEIMAYRTSSLGSHKSMILRRLLMGAIGLNMADFINVKIIKGTSMYSRFSFQVVNAPNRLVDSAELSRESRKSILMLLTRCVIPANYMTVRSGLDRVNRASLVNYVVLFIQVIEHVKCE